MKKFLAGLLALGSFSTYADSSILKIQAQALNMDASKLAVTSSMGRSSMAMTCDNFDRFDMKLNIQKLEYKTFKPKGLFGKKKKIKELSEMQASLLSETLVIENLCPLYTSDQENDDMRLDLVRSFRKLMEYSQRFLSLVLSSK